MRNEDWEEEFVEGAEQTVQHAFADWYLRPVAATVRADVNAAVSLTDGTTDQPGIRARYYRMGRNGNAGSRTELDRYLEEPLVGMDVDVLAFWKARTDLPVLQHMARHYLCVPAKAQLRNGSFQWGVH